MKKDPRFQPVDAAVTPRFAGIATFMRTQRFDVSPDLDIALVGVPFDIGVNYRAGARQGPAAVREASRLIRRVHNVSGIAPYDLCNVADVGDAPVNPIDLHRSIQMIEDFFATIHAAGALPLSIGGDHTVPLPILRALAKDRPVGIFHIDSHADTLDTLADTKINHATTFRRGVEEGLIDPKRTIQIGLRGSMYDLDDFEWGEKMGVRLVRIEEAMEKGPKAIMAEARRIVGDGPTYVSFDIDMLDPVYAPGTGTPEIGGFTTFQAQQMLRELRGLNIVGADVVEVSPPFDPSGITAHAGVTMMFEILCSMAEDVAKRR